MKHTFFLLLATLLLCTGPAAFSQHNPSAHRCGTTQAHEVLLHTVPGLAESNRALEEQAQHWLANWQLQRGYRTGDTIPVVFHVVYNAPQENISDVQLLSQLAVLNEDFNRKNADASQTPDAFKPLAGNPQLVFCLAALDPNGLPTTGITRTNTSRTNFAHTETAMKFDSEGGKSAWNPELYLNIWVVNLAGNFLGFAQFPGGPAATDGIVLMYRSTGRAPANPFPGNYNRGRTATHEVGHWLGLRHIWGEDETSCTDSDLVEDTPNQKGPSSGCPIFPKISDCNPTPPGEMFMNFMDYTNDACMNLFTHGQAARME
ncbi:MAG TPA: zinc metalloprotease, partial [Adhaeribacter sp.]|nr:zinc metalloprotease [Adhaeribacter sp.]